MRQQLSNFNGHLCRNVVFGERDGVTGTVEKLLLRHLHAYLIRPENGEEPFQASDMQVKLHEA